MLKFSVVVPVKNEVDLIPKTLVHRVLVKVLLTGTTLLRFLRKMSEKSQTENPSRTEFSVVIPIKGTKEETKMISRTLPSYYSINPAEVVLVVDDPPEDSRIIPLIQKIAEKCDAKKITRIIRVPKGGWGDQQMKARRTGFLHAKYNRILTGDIDLIINRNVLKAIEKVGNGIGLVSCQKFRMPRNILSLYRLFTETMLRILSNVIKRKVGATSFTGLYAFWKPYWLEVEPLSLSKKFVKLKAKIREGKPVEISDFYGAGDDTFLRDLMVKKYKCVYLKDIGAIVLSDPWEDRPIIQYGKGVYFAKRGRSLIVSLARSIIRAQPYYLIGHVHARKINDKLKYVIPLVDKIKDGA